MIKRSNCLIESIKWKLKHPEFKIRCKYYSIWQFHIYCESKDYIVDFKDIDKKESTVDYKSSDRLLFLGRLRIVHKRRGKTND